MKTSFSKVAQNRFLGTGLRKFLILQFGALALITCIASNSWATEHVITMYFGGTSLPVNAWKPEINKYERPSLIAALHRHHRASYDNQYKIFIPGVGAPETTSGQPAWHCAGPSWFPGSDAFIQKTFPHTHLCRWWGLTVQQALDKFDLTVKNILDKYVSGDTFTLNVVGHSRGAIAAMWFLYEGMNAPDGFIMRQMYQTGDLDKINLILLDPVPGIGMLASDDPEIGRGGYADVNDIGWPKFRLGNWLTRFVAIYAADERSNKFSGIFPLIDPATETLIFSTRGAHQTIVGNLWKGGHAPVNFPRPCFLSSCNEDQEHPTLQIINDIVALTIVELFKSPNWGTLRYWSKVTHDDEVFQFEKDLLKNPFNQNPDFRWSNRKEAFYEKTSSMNGVHPGGDNIPPTIYRMIQAASYFAWIFPPGVPLEHFEGTCFRAFQTIDGTVLDPILPRCMEAVLASGHMKFGLGLSGKIPGLGTGLGTEEAWNRIRVLGHGDDDEDGVANPDDNCPNKPNPGQQDGDNDGIGDACEELVFVSGFEGTS